MLWRSGWRVMQNEDKGVFLVRPIRHLPGLPNLQTTGKVGRDKMPDGSTKLVQTLSHIILVEESAQRPIVRKELSIRLTGGTVVNLAN